MEAMETSTEKIASDSKESPVKSVVDADEVESAAKKQKLENNEIAKTSPPKERRKMRKDEKFAQESEALLKEMGIDNAGDDNSNRRRTRSQARGVPTPPVTPVEKSSRRSRKSKEAAGSTDSGKSSSTEKSRKKDTRKGRGRGRPVKNANKSEGEENEKEEQVDAEEKSESCESVEKDEVKPKEEVTDEGGAAGILPEEKDEIKEKSVEDASKVEMKNEKAAEKEKENEVNGTDSPSVEGVTTATNADTIDPVAGTQEKKENATPDSGEENKPEEGECKKVEEKTEETVSELQPGANNN